MSELKLTKMNLLVQQHITTRYLTHNFAKIKKEKKLSIVMSGSKPSNILLPFDEVILDVLRPFIKMSKRQKKIYQSIDDFRAGKGKTVQELKKKYGIKSE